MASLMVEIPDFSTLRALGIYGLTVVFGVHCILSPTLLLILQSKSNKIFSKRLRPQLLAFSTSSSAIASDDGVTENVGVDEEVSSFVLPLGATVNGWYKSISGSSSHFIAQAMLPNPLDLNTQLMIVVTATLASIGSAAVPSWYGNACYRFRSSWNSRQD
jgi:Na+/H+-dicarboxylate symporter